MNILGIGTDLVETARIASALDRLGDSFLKRCFTESEIAYCQRHANASLPFAARWAAKEAIAKAFGTGIGPEMSLVELEIVKLPSGQPTVVLHGNALKHAQNIGVVEIKISLTHTEHYAAAYALVLVGAKPIAGEGS